MIAFHGTADESVPYHGGLSPSALASTRFARNARQFPSVPGWAANWAQRNQCATNPVESAVAPDVGRLEYTRCADDAAVVLYTIRGGGHTWPGGAPLPEGMVGPTSRTIDATSRMWAFFREHPLRVAPRRSDARAARP